MQAKAQLAQTLMDSGSNMEIQWTGDFNNSNLSNGSIPNNNYQTQIMNNPTPQSSLESAANNDEALLFINQNQLFHESQLSRSSQEPQILQPFPRKKFSSSHADLGELHALALRMMRN